MNKLKCYAHKETDAVAACVICGNYLCEECVQEIRLKVYCSNCLDAIIKESDSKQNKTSTKNIKPRRDVFTAGILGIFLGGFRAHKFYLGKPFQGILFFICSIMIWPFILGFIEGIYILSMTQEEFNKKYFKVENLK